MKKAALLYFFFVTIFSIAQDTYVLSTASNLQIVGTSSIHDWMVTAEMIEGSLKLTNGVPETIKFQVSAIDLKSERGATMDNKMHHALKAEEHPQITFELTEIKNSNTLLGIMVIAGVSKPVSVKVAMNIEKNSFSIIGEQPINLLDFEIEPPTAMFGQIIVGDVVTVKFDLVFEKTDH